MKDSSPKPSKGWEKYDVQFYILLSPEQSRRHGLSFRCVYAGRSDMIPSHINREFGFDGKFGTSEQYVTIYHKLK